MLRLVLLVVVCLVTAQARLTSKELRAFENDGRCGGTIKVTPNEDDGTYTIESNGLPDHFWQCVNPNEPSANSMTYTVPIDPVIADQPYCLQFGTMGIATNGVSFYSPVTADTWNAVEGDTEEDFDDCGGHPTLDGAYHYHRLPYSDDCNNPLYDSSKRANKNGQFLGIAIDGNPIYSQWDGLNTDELDICHGMKDRTGRYMYVAVWEHFPYILGCYRSQPDDPDSQEQCGEDGGDVCVCGDEMMGTSVAWYDECDITCGGDKEAECGACPEDKRQMRERRQVLDELMERKRKLSMWSRMEKRGIIQYGRHSSRLTSRDVTSSECHDDEGDEDYDIETGLCTFEPEPLDSDEMMSGSGLPPTDAP